MKRSVIGIGVLALALGIQGPSMGQDDKPSLEDRVQELEQELERARIELVESTRKSEEVTKALEEVQAYLKEQADAAKSMARTLDASEEAGFTYGINPDSRHILLEGWRSRLDTQCKNLPGVKKPAPVDTSRRGQRRH